MTIAKMPLRCFTLDGATDVKGTQVLNMMTCGPMAYILEHFTIELRRKSAANLLAKVIDCKQRLLMAIMFPST
ncbi:TPA: hypothetical protein N0F65_007493 [Lagenidium giganteum]|uniref:Uncharacterized protein n=1 Tax=Lagenidium giganteum TaxID=4803 RepID=A0AAV2ZHD3_9STRA|nr:TPA: hypothetical protein N0F65_007493 [Lagenidium giganteum]